MDWLDSYVTCVPCAVRRSKQDFTDAYIPVLESHKNRTGCVCGNSLTYSLEGRIINAASPGCAGAISLLFTAMHASTS